MSTWVNKWTPSDTRTLNSKVHRDFCGALRDTTPSLLPHARSHTHTHTSKEVERRNFCQPPCRCLQPLLVKCEDVNLSICRRFLAGHETVCLRLCWLSWRIDERLPDPVHVSFSKFYLYTDYRPLPTACAMHKLGVSPALSSELSLNLRPYRPQIAFCICVVTFATDPTASIVRT
jgi:hypothetical protein